MEVMDQELAVASKFIRSLASKSLTISQGSDFEMRLVEVLRSLYQGHWYPEEPHRASAYRCITCMMCLDPSVRRAAELSGIDAESLYTSLPEHLTVWVDPRDVSYRVGERGHVVCLWRNGSFLDQKRRAMIELPKSRAFTRSNLPTTHVAAYPWLWQAKTHNPDPSSLYAAQLASGMFLTMDKPLYDAETDFPASNQRGRRSESPLSSRSASPVSASPVLSEEDEDVSAEDGEHSSTAYLPRSGNDKLTAGARKVSVLSRAAPEFAPRIPLPSSRVGAQVWTLS